MVFPGEIPMIMGVELKMETENGNIGNSLVLKGPGPKIQHTPTNSESTSFGSKGPGEKQIDVVTSVLQENGINYVKEDKSLEVLYSMVIEPNNLPLAVNCVTQIHINRKERRPEFVFTDMLLGVQVADEELTNFATQLCNGINDFSATNGGFIVYSKDMDQRFRYRNGMLLPEGELPRKMMEKLFYYASIVIDGFIITLKEWVDIFNLSFKSKTDTYYQITKG